MILWKRVESLYVTRLQVRASHEGTEVDGDWPNLSSIYKLIRFGLWSRVKGYEG